MFGAVRPFRWEEVLPEAIKGILTEITTGKEASGICVLPLVRPSINHDTHSEGTLRSPFTYNAMKVAST